MSHSAKPVFILVPGAFCPGLYFHKVADILKSQGYEAISIDRPTLGRKPEIPAPSLYDDGDHVRSIAAGLLDSGKDVILCANSYGGSVVYEACKGITKSERSSKPGGDLRHLVLLGSLLSPKGITVAELLGVQISMDPEEEGSGPTYMDQPPAAAMQEVLFGSLPDEEKKHYGSMGRPQSRASMTVPMTFAAYEVVPTTLVISKNGEYCRLLSPPNEEIFDQNLLDKVLDVGKQEDSFDAAVKKGIKGLRKVYLDSDHCSMLSNPDDVVRILLEAADDSP